MINKINIINSRLNFLYELKSDIEMNLQLNKDLNFPIEENERDLNRCLLDTNNRIGSLELVLNNLNA